MKLLRLMFWPLLFCVAGCGLGDDFDEVPMFVEVSTIDLITAAGQPADSHAIQDVWVSIDGFSRGIFEVKPGQPAKIPVLSNGETVRVEFFAGIRSNGVTLSPFLYPFIERIVFDLEFRPEEVIPLDIVFEYKEYASFLISDDFEGATLFTEDLDDHNSALEVSSDPELVEYGNGCGKFVVTEENRLFEQATAQIYSTDVFKASNVFVELDYKSDVDFGIGYVGYFNGIKTTWVPGGGRKSDNWKKLYLDFSVFLNGGNVDEFQLLIAGASVNTGTILIDNVKLVYLEN